ncbi:MAG: TIGR03546 family protein [Planctomycetaceae bacterium]|nr:TIGR03546 family protein [Planctomycetaceae bacterium]
MFFVRSLRLMIRALTAESSHKQIAVGIALGMIVGLVPKGNLLAFVLLMSFSSLRISLPAVFFSAFAFSWVAMLIDPVTHWVGEAVLTQSSLVPFWTWLYDHPLVPWTQFNNTIVMGSLLIGIGACYPLYRVALHLVEKYEPAVSTRVKKMRLSKWLFGAEWLGRVRSAV